MSKTNNKKISAKEIFSTKNITLMAVMTALSVIMYIYLKFKVPFFPSFLSIHFSELPVVLAGYMIHPVAAVIILVVRMLLKLPTTTTSGVGEIADLLVALAFCLPANIIYHIKKNKKTALIGLIVGVVSALIVAIIANMAMFVPYFVNIVYGGSWTKIVNSVDKVLPESITVTQENFYAYYIPLAVIPFNLLRLGACAVVTFFSYKYLSKASNKFFNEIIKKSPKPDTSKNEDNSIDKESLSLQNAENVNDKITAHDNKENINGETAAHGKNKDNSEETVNNNTKTENKTVPPVSKSEEKLL